MPTFEFNMIRGQIRPLRRRKIQLQALIAYLLLCSVGLIYAFGHATRAFLAANLQSRDIKRLESEFKAEHPQQDDIMEYASLLKYNINLMSDSIALLESTVGNRFDLARMIVGISAPLPDESFIIEIRLEPASNKLTFDIAIPSTGSADTIPNAGDLVGLWSNDNELMNAVGKLSATSSRRRLIGGVPHFILKFNGEVMQKVTS